MKVVGLMPVRNEDWCLGFTLRVALTWCDAVVVLLHSCTDRSAEIVKSVAHEYPGKIAVLAASNTDWPEMSHRQAMLIEARRMEATHIAVIDADELLTANVLCIIRHALLEQMPASRILQLQGFNVRGGLTRYHSNGIWADRWFSLGWRDKPGSGWAGDRYHHREPLGFPAHCEYRPMKANDTCGIVHLWGANERRLRAKHAWYKLTERLRWPAKDVSEIDRMYSLAVHGDASVPAAKWEFASVPEEWLKPYKLWMDHLHIDLDPWQEAEVRRMVREHPGIERGLDLFGVDHAS